jgi:hypothetical protein
MKLKKQIMKIEHKLINLKINKVVKNCNIFPDNTIISIEDGLQFYIAGIFGDNCKLILTPQQNDNIGIDVIDIRQSKNNNDIIILD